MKSAIRIVASSFGILAGLASIEHGYFETLQGNVKPGSILITSIGHLVNRIRCGMLANLL